MSVDAVSLQKKDRIYEKIDTHAGAYAYQAGKYCKRLPFSSTTSAPNVRNAGVHFVDLDGFFQADVVIRDLTVTGVQTCALPICPACAADFRDDRLLGVRDLLEEVGCAG